MSVRNSKITVIHEKIQIVWRKPKKQRANIHYSRKQSPDPLQSRLQKTPRVKAVRKKMKRIDSLREARTLLFGLCNRRKNNARRKGNLEGKPPLENLHHERRGPESGMELVHTTSASGQRCSGRPASQMFGSQNTDVMSRKRA